MPIAKKFAVGYYFHPNNFVSLVSPYLSYLTEVYFPLPGIASAREIGGEEKALRNQLVQDLQALRAQGLKLDLLINSSCYGEKAYSSEFRHEIEDAIKYLDDNGVKPDVVTTTSLFVARVVKMKYPEIDNRASVNLKIGSTVAMEYIDDIFDSLYMRRELQRDIPTVLHFRQWCDEHHKKLCMLVNSGCIQNCPAQMFHENLVAHGFWRAFNESYRLNSGVSLCWEIFHNRQMYEEVLRGAWIRPEDVHIYEPYIDVFKLSTRDEVLNADLILKAYTSGDYDGNLLELLDPNFTPEFHNYYIDNKSFPENWVTSQIAGKCANMCTHCGKCTAILQRVLKKFPEQQIPMEAKFSFSADNLSIGSYSFVNG